jgi:hypothetical protein
LQCQRIRPQGELKTVFKKRFRRRGKKTAESKKKQQHQQIGRFYCGKKASDLEEFCIVLQQRPDVTGYVG